MLPPLLCYTGNPDAVYAELVTEQAVFGEEAHARLRHWSRPLQWQTSLGISAVAPRATAETVEAPSHPTRQAKRAEQGASLIEMRHQRPYLRLNLSTRPPVSITFCLPVKNGWHEEQTSTCSSLPKVERVVNSLPQLQTTLISVYLGWIPSFMMTLAVARSGAKQSKQRGRIQL